MSDGRATLARVTDVGPPASGSDEGPEPGAPALTADELVQLTGGRLLHRSSRAIRGAAVDSRLVGPDRLFETRGHPKQVAASRAARDPESARRLWEVSESLTGVRYAL